MRNMLLCLCLILAAPLAQAERLKDIASVAGVRANQLIGYGLVVGLVGSGDQTSQTPFTVQTFNNMLTEFGITVPPGTRIQTKNVAAVAIHAELPAFSRPG
jgi:flagellar P-ring protein precursor FlgI